MRGFPSFKRDADDFMRLFAIFKRLVHYYLLLPSKVIPGCLEFKDLGAIT
jgi:hypothetical protein